MQPGTLAKQQADHDVSDQASPIQNIPVYTGDQFRVALGANLGDGMSFYDELIAEDVYSLAPGAAQRRLALRTCETGVFFIAPGTELGTVGARLHLDCAIDLMSPDGQVHDALILVEVDDDGHVAVVYLLPLSPLRDKTDYILVGKGRRGARRKFAQVACVSFTRGTHITTASGAQVPIEDLNIGDRILTRDHGAQPVRWIGQSTVRAAGDFAPIVIKAGTLNNAGDLVLSPNHRLFVYQRSDRIGAGQSELLVKARHLVNGETVHVQRGGFVEYFQILFDMHHIIYAEGIAAESMLIDPRTRPVLPPELLNKLGPLMPGHYSREPHGLDVQKALLDRPDAIDILRRASAG